MRKIGFLIGIFIFITFSLFADVEITATNYGFDIKNDDLKVLIDREGGKIKGIEFKDFKLENITIFENRIFPKTGEFDITKAIFKEEVLKGKGVRLIYEISESENKFLYGLVFEKIITILPRGSGIKIDIILKNNSDKIKKPGVVVENRKLPSSYFIYPSSNGIKKIEELYDIYSLNNLVEGWCGFSFEKKGLIFLFDYGNTSGFKVDLKIGKLEWQFDRISIPPGKEVIFSTFLIFMENISDVVYASPYLICGIKRDKNKIINFFQQSFYTLNIPFEVETELIEWENRKMIKSERFKNNNGLPAEYIIFLPDNFNKHLLLKTSVKSENVNLKFERFFEENYPVYPEYKIIQPLKNKKIPFPGNLKITEERKILFLKGLYYDGYKIEEVLKRIEGVEIKESYFTDKGYIYNGSSLTYFPDSYEEIFKFKLIIMADIDGNSIGDEGRTYLKGFVENGGNLIVFGGPYSFGRGRFEGTYIEEILPVKIREICDLKMEIEKIEKTEKCPFWIKWNSEKGGVVIWSHIFDLKKGAEVWLKSGKNPFLIFSKYGNGKVFVFAGTNLGIAPQGKKEFWETDEWLNLLYGIIEYALKN